MIHLFCDRCGMLFAAIAIALECGVCVYPKEFV